MNRLEKYILIKEVDKIFPTKRCNLNKAAQIESVIIKSELNVFELHRCIL